MGNLKTGVIVAGNEHSKTETIKILATAVGKSDNMIGQVVGRGMLDNAEAIANSPAYMEAVEVLALYLAEYGTGSSDEVDELKDTIEELRSTIDDLEDENDNLQIEMSDLEDKIEELTEDKDEDEDEDEEMTDTCAECGEVVPLDDGDYLGGRFICGDCLRDAVDALNA